MRKEIWKQTAALQATNEKKNMFAKQITELKVELKASGITPVMTMKTNLKDSEEPKEVLYSDQEDEVIDVNELNDESIEVMTSICRFTLKHKITCE